MPTTFENLAIGQHRDTLRYAIIGGGGYRPSICRFHVGDYVYLQQTTSTTLDVTTGRIILRVQKVLASGVLMLEGRVGVIWKDHVRNSLQQKRGILRSKYPRKQQRNQIPKTRSSEHEFIANS